MKIDCMDALEKIKTLKDNSQDIIYADPPYLLGSTVKIGKDGKPFYEKAVDFMNAWDGKAIDEKFWEEFFKEANRALKYGGRILFFGIDRQLFLFQYYAVASGLEIKQSLYWYFICNDETTELLTKRGWLNYKDIKKTDVVLTMNTKNETSEWQNIEDTHLYQVEDLDMTRIRNRDIDQLVTPNHRVLHQSRTNNRYNFSNWKYTESANILGKKNPLIKLPLSFENHQGKEEHGDKFCHLLGWVFSDGYYQKGDNSVRISQSSTNMSKVKIIRELLFSLGLNHKEYNRDRIYEYKGIKKEYTEYVFYFNNETSKWIKEEYPNRIPSYDLLDMTNSERYNLFLGLMGGDGGYKMINEYKDIYEALSSDENFNGTFTKSKRTVDFMQSLCSSLGFSTSIMQEWSDKKATLSVSHKQTTGIQQAKNKLFAEKYTGDVWSITTKNRNYCIRRNNKVSFTGNSNFPKATDLPKKIDKRHSVDRGNTGISKIMEKSLNKKRDLSKKYEGFKYSISPLKQVLETVMVFQKQTKNKSVLDDVFAHEDGDLSISPSIWGTDEGRVPTESELGRLQKDSPLSSKNGFNDNLMGDRFQEGNKLGRFPSQLFVDKECASKIDEQSGELTSGARKESYQRRGTNPNDTYGKFNEDMMDDAEKDSGGASRILHHIGYLDEELDLVIYSPKVSTFEREVGCDGFNESIISGETNEFGKMGINTPEMRAKRGVKTELPKVKNNHPTLKPIKLNYQIFKLLKTPNTQNVFFPFSGAGSEIIGAIQAGFDSDLFECSEISEEFVAIAEARVKAWENLDINDLESSKKHIEKLSKEDLRQGSLF